MDLISVGNVNAKYGISEQSYKDILVNIKLLVGYGEANRLIIEEYNKHQIIEEK